MARRGKGGKNKNYGIEKAKQRDPDSYPGDERRKKIIQQQQAEKRDERGQQGKEQGG